MAARIAPFAESIVGDAEMVVRQPEKPDFAYVNVVMSPNQLKRCQTAYNKSKWRGCKLNIAKANRSYMNLLQSRWDHETKFQANLKERTDARKRHLEEEAVREQKQDLRKKRGWTAGPGDNPIALLRIRDPKTFRVAKILKKDVMAQHTFFNDSDDDSDGEGDTDAKATKIKKKKKRQKAASPAELTWELPEVEETVRERCVASAHLRCSSFNLNPLLSIVVVVVVVVVGGFARRADASNPDHHVLLISSFVVFFFFFFFPFFL